MRCDDHTEPDTCLGLKRERIRYFTGRHMTARDFTDADDYHRSMRYLHNRVLHGWGIVCGLTVRPHHEPKCRPCRVIVRCGLAIDCCGREIVVPKDVVSGVLDWDGRVSDDHVALLALAYRETPTEKGPVFYSTEACGTPPMEHGRIREGYALTWHWVKRADLPAWGWVNRGSCGPDEDSAGTDKDGTKRPDHCDDPSDGCCFEPDCPLGNVVPLAVIDLKGPEELASTGRIDVSGRRVVAQAREQLTHICRINWEHGGLIKVSQLKELRVTFDRRLLPAEHPWRPGPRGINERTFMVQYGEQLDDRPTEDFDFVEYAEPPTLEANGRTAVYKILRPGQYRNHVIHVTLRCDFIVDCARRPVDGDHLAGELPSGDGVPGGTFESWFRVVDDDEYERLTKQAETTSQTGAKEI
jgi:hypothetical protein